MMKILALGAVFLAAFTGSSAAQPWDNGGCNGSGMSCRKLGYYCSLGSQTPVSVRRFCDRGGGDRYGRRRGRDRSHDDDRGERSRPLSYGELRYFCSQGDQTPISVREDCIRAGLW